jgi:alpha-glucosidase
MDPTRYAAQPRLLSWRAGRGGALALALEAAVAEVTIAPDGSTRLRAAPGDALRPDPGPAIGRDPQHPAHAPPHPRAGNGVGLGHEGPKGTAYVEIDADPFALRVRDRSGGIVAELRGLAFAPGGRATISVTARPGERFFGFGEKTGGLDKRGTQLRMRNRDPELRVSDPLHVAIPFFLGLAHGSPGPRARGVLLEALAPSNFDVAATRADRVAIETDAGGIDVTVFPGPEPHDVVRRFTERVGRSPLPPLWALGHHQSRWSYASEREVRELAAEIRRRHIPTDVIHLDIDHMDGCRVFTWHPKRFPNPQRLLSDLAEQGFRVVAIVDPGVKADPEYRVFRTGTELDCFCRNDDGTPYTLMVWPKRAALPDFNRAEVRSWWGEQHEALLGPGVAGVWNDMNEPAGWASEVRLGRFIVPLRRQNLSRVRQSDPLEPERSVPHEQVRNIYGQQHCRATRAALESARPGQRPFVLTRSGYAGIQRFAAVWTGDNHSRWSHLRLSLPMLLNLSLSGAVFCGADIGGFALPCTPELYARWIQIGALYPFARTHSMWLKRRQEPWSFGRRVEAIARSALELRMRLLPYLYGLFREAEQSGAPVWRPLFYEFPDDPEAASIEDQVLVGPSLLIAPVLEKGARERELYLPPGVWMSWHDDARYVGPRRIRVAAPLEHLPLFVRGGSLIPTRSPVAHVGMEPDEPLVLRLFPGADGKGELVEDDGESTAYRDGAVARTSLQLRDRAGGRLRLEMGRREGGYQIPPRPLRIVAHGCSIPDAVHLDGDRLADGTATPGYGVANGRVQVRLLDRGEAHVLEIEPAP